MMYDSVNFICGCVLSPAENAALATSGAITKEGSTIGHTDQFEDFVACLVAQ